MTDPICNDAANAARPSTVDRLVQRLRDAIGSGELPGGHRLVEADLTEAYQVSRGPVREAMRRLAAEGLIEMHHHRGARVRQLSRQEVCALFEVREMLEGLSARLAAANATDEDRATLSALGAAMHTAASAGDLAGYLSLNSRFHHLVVEIGGNPHLPQILAQLHTQAMRFQFRSLIGPESVAVSDREHQRIITAILDADADYAERAMRLHIQRARALLAQLPDAMFAANA